KRRWDQLAAMSGDPELASEKRLRRGRAQTHDRARLHQRDLRIEPRATRSDLARARFLVNPPFAARLPLEVLDDVGDPDRGAIDAGLGERPIEQLAGRADKRMPGEILLVARLFADQHQPGG